MTMKKNNRKIEREVRPVEGLFEGTGGKARTESARPVLRFSPTAWAKLHFFCHRGESEIGGFGISASGALLFIDEFLTVKQKTTEVTVAFDDQAVADLFE